VAAAFIILLTELVTDGHILYIYVSSIIGIFPAYWFASARNRIQLQVQRNVVTLRI